MTPTSNFECAVIGGGAAGLSAALVLGRARRTTLVLDDGRQSNSVAPTVGGLLGFDEIAPHELYRLARHQLAAYPSVRVQQGTVSAISASADAFQIVIDGTTSVRAKRVLIATGMRYDLPDVPGLASLWGDTVFHCPFCHGWELRDRPLAVLGNGAAVVHRTLLLRNWTDNVVLLTDGPSAFDDDARAELATAGITVIETPVARLIDCSRHGACGKHLEAIAFADGSELARSGLMVTPILRQRDDLVEQLDLSTTERGTIACDARGRTSVPGVYAAGDLSTEIQSVAGAIGSGSTAAAWIVNDLLAARHPILERIVVAATAARGS